MSAVVTEHGPKTFKPVELVAIGQVVEARASGRIGVAAAGSTRVVGVAVTHGQSEESISSEPLMVNGRPTLVASFVPPIVSVAYSGAEVSVTYSAAAIFGDRLVPSSSGRVAPAGAGADPRTIIGICTALAGVDTGATGLMRIL